MGGPGWLTGAVHPDRDRAGQHRDRGPHRWGHRPAASPWRDGRQT